jgi:hypothetical protein
MCVYVRKLTFVPGPNDRSQAIYCLEQVQSKIRPVGHGLILTRGWLVVLIVARLLDPIPIPGNKLPGYDHSVPTGQQGRYPCGTQTRHSTEGRKHPRPYVDAHARPREGTLHDSVRSLSSSNLVTYSRKPKELLYAILRIVSSYPLVLIAFVV